MVRSALLACSVMLFFVLAPKISPAQTPSSYERDADPSEPGWKIGIELTPRLLENLIEKGMVEFNRTYKLDPFQEEEMRILLDRTVKTFLKENHVEMQSTLNEWLEEISAPIPPDADTAADFGRRMLPLIEKFRGTLDEFRDGADEFLNDEQQMILQGQLAMVEVATGFTEQRAREFADGGWDPARHWPGSAEFQSEHSPAETRAMMSDMYTARQQARELYAQTGSATAAIQAARRTPSGGGKADSDNDGPIGGAPQRPSTTNPDPEPTRAAAQQGTPDDWSKYVDAFIAKYNLNAEQQQKARTWLKYAQDARDRHNARHARDFEKLTEMYKAAEKSGNRRELELAESRHERLMRDVEQIFASLKERLERLPTRQQRRDAQQQAAAKPAQ